MSQDRTLSVVPRFNGTANETLSETHLNELPQREEFPSRKGRPV